MELEGVKGRCVDMELEIRPADSGAVYNKFAVKFAAGGRYYTTLSFHPRDRIMKIDRKFSGSRRAVIHQRRCKVLGKHDGRINVRIILDRYSAEVFINGGEQVMTATFHTPLEADEISFNCIGTARMDIVKYDLQ
jgi:beta-fructofuranosidase